MTDASDTFLAIPNTGQIHIGLASFLLSLKDTGCSIMLSDSKPICRNRNHIAQTFLETGKKWLLMIDSDIVPPDNILDMRKNDKPICSAYAAVLRGNDSILPVAGKEISPYQYQFQKEWLKPDLHQVDAVGTGCVLIRRDAFDGLSQPYFEFRYSKATGNLFIGEDYNFCRKSLKSIWFDSRFKCTHYQIYGVS